MELFFIIIVIIVLLFFISKAKTPTPNLEYPYEMHKVLFSPAERSFYGVLLKATEGKSIVFGKVRVADILKPQKGLTTSLRQSAFNKIKAKHFDFVLCNEDDLSIKAVVELDDSSHNSKARKARDEFLDKACESAGLNLIHIKASSSYSINGIREIIFQSEPS